MRIVCEQCLIFVRIKCVIEMSGLNVQVKCEMDVKRIKYMPWVCRKKCFALTA